MENSLKWAFGLILIAAIVAAFAVYMSHNDQEEQTLFNVYASIVEVRGENVWRFHLWYKEQEPITDVYVFIDGFEKQHYPLVDNDVNWGPKVLQTFMRKDGDIEVVIKWSGHTETFVFYEKDYLE